MSHEEDYEDIMKEVDEFFYESEDPIEKDDEIKLENTSWSPEEGLKWEEPLAKLKALAYHSRVPLLGEERQEKNGQTYIKAGNLPAPVMLIQYQG